jgi:DNA-binding transcriptional regulator YiaG
MYATYQVDKPSQPTTQTTFVKDDVYSLTTIQSTNLRGRILTYCVAGTFGLLSPTYLHASAATANWHINQIEINGEHKATADPVSASARDISHIREVTKISVSELARIFGVSRQAVHEWIKGGPLAPKNAQLLSELAQVADIFLESGIDVTPQILRRKIGGGQSILESLKQHSKAVELAQALVDTLSRESQQRQRLVARLAGRPNPPLTDIDFGTPHVNEDV